MHTRLRFSPSSTLLLSPPYFSVHQRFPFFSSGFYLFIYLFFLLATRLAAFNLSLTKCQSIISASLLSHSFSPPPPSSLFTFFLCCPTHYPSRRPTNSSPSCNLWSPIHQSAHALASLMLQRLRSTSQFISFT